VDDGQVPNTGHHTKETSTMSITNGNPFNAVTGADYAGGNIDRLLNAEAENGYASEGGWAGFKQWLTVGRVVRKGEHGTPCLTVITVDDGDKESKRPRGFRVFHFDQTVEV
jgi:antirestriction protein ArdC